MSLSTSNTAAYMDLSLNKLTGTLPTTIGQLTRLQNLAIAFNALSGSIPTEVGLLTSLGKHMLWSVVHGEAADF